MNTRENYRPWTPEEEALLFMDYTMPDLARHPLMVANGRSYNSIRKKRAKGGVKSPRPRKVRPVRTALQDAMKGKPYTDEQRALVLNEQYSVPELASMPIFQDRTIGAIQTLRHKLRLARQVEAAPPKVRIRVKPKEQSRQLYQFISIKDATPARVKVWQAEERAMQTF